MNATLHTLQFFAALFIVIAGIRLAMFANFIRCQRANASCRRQGNMKLLTHQADVKSVNMRGFRHALSVDTELKFLALH